MKKEDRVYTVGELAAHARGKTLSAAFGAQAAGTLPAGGTVLVFGRQFQKDAALATVWSNWTASPGRLLVLLPPYGQETCSVPVNWEAKRAEALAGGETDLGKLLSGERQFEIRGQLLPLEKIAGQVATAGWRRHPAAGLWVVTSLPLWSLSTLDHQKACRSWLDGLLQQAGEAKKEAPTTAPEQRELTTEEWIVMLHLCSALFSSTDEALEALARSTVHNLDAELAQKAIHALRQLGLVTEGALTGRGKELLLNGPYAVYARALWSQHA